MKLHYLNTRINPMTSVGTCTFSGKYIQLPRLFRHVAVLSFLLLALCGIAKAQQDYSGVYYIANKIWNASNKTSPYYNYSYTTPENNWYLVPAADPQLSHYSDAYFNDQYCNTNSSANDDYTGNNYGDSEKPFLTTYRTNRDNNSIWIIKKTGNYYYIIHALTGKYVKYQPPYKSFNTRKTMHLEAVDNDSPGNEFQYSIDTYTENNIEGFNIAPRNRSGYYFNPAGDNWPRYYGTNDGNKTPYSSGMVGVWNATGGGSLWPRENDARLVLTPTIGDINPYNNTVTITCDFVPPSCQIVYTTDGNDPTAATATTCNSGDQIPVTGTMTIKATVVGYGMVLGNIASKEVTAFVLDQPTFVTTCDNKLEIVCPNMPNGGQIRYITTVGDGTQDAPVDPTSASTLYEGAITVAPGTKVKAMAFYGAIESVVSDVHTHSFTHTVAPTIEVTNSTTITITGPTGSTIYYTIDADAPVIGAPGVVSHASPVTIPNSDAMMVIRAIAKTSTLDPSCVITLVTMGTPVINLIADDCSATSPRGNVISMYIPSDGSKLFYAVTAAGGSAPDVNAVPNPYSEYTGEVVLDGIDGANTNYTVYAYSQSSDGSSVSSVASASREMKTGGKPILTPPVGSNPVVIISGGVFGDVAVCSATGVADQQIVIASDGTCEYVIAPEATGTLTVYFKHGNWLPSCESTFMLPSAPATPTMSQDCANRISISCATPMADIHYTTNNTEPTLTSLTYTTGCLDNIDVGTRVRAKAFDGFRSSGELDFVYSATHSSAPQFFVEGTLVTISGENGANVYYNLSTNGNNTIPAEPQDATTSSTLYNGNYELTGITIFNAIAVNDGMLPSCPVRVLTREGYSINSASDLSKLAVHNDKYFFVFEDIDASSYTTTVDNFTGVIEGNSHTISNLTKPLFGTATGAVIHDLTLDNVVIDITESGTNVGAIACNANGATRIYNCGITGNSSVSGTQYVGGLVGLLDGSTSSDSPRVINCFSYADINGGTHRGGIVGYNNYASTSSSIRTMVMNCMFYGDISIDGNLVSVAPVYGGAIIHNKRVSNNNTGLNNYCYFYYKGAYLNQKSIPITYNGALGSEERFLNRFEFFRQTLNSTRNMAAYYVSGVAAETDHIAKWVLKPSVAPYPVLDASGYYPSRVNLDAEHAVPIDPDNVNYNKGRKLGSLTVNIEMGDGAHFNHPDGAEITTTTLILNITDKDPDNFNFNYKKIQLPYYNQVGEGNYTGNRVVTGWKIVKVNGSTTGTGTFVNNSADFPAFNFADRACSNKDLYSVSGRVWNQGAYWEVPDGVSSITIQPYWAKAAYLSDATYDVTYINADKYEVTVAGNCPTSFNEQTVYNVIEGTGSAIEYLELDASHTVYDYAVVLVGNYHQYATGSIYNNTLNKPVTFMSADADGDCEPDNSLFYYHYQRQKVAPIRFDFLNMPGIGMVKRTHDSPYKPEPGIFKPSGWFEVTNTVNLYCGQFEYCDGTSSDNFQKLYNAPLILQGGIYQQFVSSFKGNAPDYTPYIHVGGNAWFKNFANGCHTNTYRKTHNMPITVTGGDYENFYLTGIYRPDGTPDPENAECYIDGGRFGEVAGAGMQLIDGDVKWLVNAADIERFFGGGINGAKPITGDVTTTITNSRVTEFYGGPKFGDMRDGKVVRTTATNCRFGLFFGAGYGGTAFNRYGHVDATIISSQNTTNWGSYVNTHYKRVYDAGKNGVATSYDYEYILFSDGQQTVARFFVNYASLSLASTKDVVTNLTGCEIGRFYGGGRLGAVYGDVTSTLSDCIVEGDVFGSGFSAEVPTVMVMPIQNFLVSPEYNRTAGVFNDAQVLFPASVQYTWSNRGSNSSPFIDDGETHLIHTETSLDGLGAVYGNATLTIQGNSVVKGDVYGGGAKSSANTGDGGGACTVNILGGTYGVKDGSIVTGGNIYGGGMGDLASLATDKDPEHKDVPVTEDVVEVNIGNAEQDANNVVIYGSVFGCNNINGTPQGNATVHVYKTKHNSENVVSNLNGSHAIEEVFGGGNKASYKPLVSGKKATVHVHNCDNTIKYVYGGGNAADVGASEGVKSATDVIIDGGRILWLFGGGNGAGIDNPGANIYDDVNVTYHAGDITYFFGGSNEKGKIGGSKNVSILNDNSCSITNHIAEFYGGNNKASIEGNVGATLIMPCTTNPCQIDYLFGGSRMADISGDVTLNVYGGLYNYVFGGNNLSGTIDGDVTLNLYGGSISESAFGGNKGGSFEETFYNGGTITGNITVNVEDQCDCPLQVKNVFGAGDLAVYTAPTGEGARVYNPVVNVNNLCADKTISGSLFGGGNGDEADDTQSKGSVIGNPLVVVGDITEGHDTYRAAISGNVYGGGNAAKVVGNTEVLLQKANSTVGGDIYGGGNLADVSGSVLVHVTGGTVSQDVYGGGALADVNVTNNALTEGATTTVTLDGGTVRDIYGGGLGRQESIPIAAKVYGPVVVTVNNGTVHDVFGCNNLNGAPQGTVQVNINNNVTHNVYGGGNLAAYTGIPDVNINNGVVTGSVFGGGNQAGVGGGDVVMTGGNVLAGIYGGCNTSGTVSGDIAVNINAGIVGIDADHKANVHGGGYGASTATTGNVLVNIAQSEAVSGPTIWGDVYGGSALGNVNAANKSTTVTLNKGTINGDLYGGGLGEAEHPAAVYGAVQVTVNSGTVTGSVYGCNNVNGAPQSTVAVDIYGTDVPGSGYALGHVFGGGNQAAYGGTPVVKVHNCNNSIEYVYGGGNAANVNGTDVTVYGGNTIRNVFGGCYGANVTTGGTNVKIYGGTIGSVYGGNNHSGTIAGSILVNVNKQAEGTEPACAMKIGEVYGGGNMASSGPGTITIGCTGTLVDLGNNEHYGIDQEGIHYVYGGANQADITGAITLNITSGIVENVFGGNNHSGNISGDIHVNINKNDAATCASDWYVGTVFGGGNVAAYSGTPDVNIQNGIVSGSVFGGGNEAGVGGGDVEMTGGTILGGLYGGCNTSGIVGGNIFVNVKGGVIGSNELLDAGTLTNVFGGGYGESTSTTGNVTVTVSRASGDNPPAAPIIYGDVYGGSALGTVNDAYDDETTVNILDGTIKTKTSMVGGFTVYNGGNVFGGGLGEEGVDNVSKGQVNGVVTVNVGSFTADGNPTPCTSCDQTGNLYSGNATIEGNVYGCNNTNGSPQQNVTVNIYKTAHIEDVNEVGDDGYAIANVFGGGNRANFTATDKTTTINIWGCDNTIMRTFGGGNAAATNDVTTMIMGGHIHEAYGGGNGEVSPANINGNVHLNIHGGNIGQSYNGSNQNGVITGSSSVQIDNHGCGGAMVDEHFCGGNLANYYGNINVNIECAESYIRNLYGGCKQAHVLPYPSAEDIIAHHNDGTYPSTLIELYDNHSDTYASEYAGKGGNVHLIVKGGTYENVYGGSKGTPSVGANITGNVLLEIHGGTITNAIYGGSHIKGSIGGTIIVNVEDKIPEDACALDVSTATVYGGGNQANYPGEGVSHEAPYNYPMVNIKNATVNNVYGGGLQADVTGNPQIRVKKGSEILGNVYGGGNMGVVDGNPRVIINGKDNTDNPTE